MDRMQDLHDWYVHLLQDLYSAEQQITEALPKMANAAKASTLKKAFEKHLEETRSQIERLDGIFKDLDEKPGSTKCKGMEGLIKEGAELIEKQGKIDADVLDAALIASAQKVEHYEIAGYGTAAAYAELMGHKAHARILHKIADEEGKTDQKLTKLAEGSINKHAQANEATAKRAKSNGRTKKRTTTRSKANA